MNSRLKELRKDILKLSQAEFAKKIKITQAGLSKLEIGSSVLTERTISMICTTFNVNEEWLKYGTKPIMISKEFDALEEYFNKNDVSPLARTAIKKYLNLDAEKRKFFEEFLIECIKEINLENI